ncbi:hypothetical protein [Hoyosella subflava]|uniref:Putative lipoprotein n=1 Tax=Hoyosella subflava (strain DSM 45089 / JCM 17490 / NBRC 109087 / DQS3-9A1) TaxID=443218 RepID=F6ESI3_HOYSD|nr:hypothetical protein [Hoyosella subflava]AEF43104.1 Putative lipoprotein [Hoyosella subflava DQS3-9A1]
MRARLIAMAAVLCVGVAACGSAPQDEVSENSSGLDNPPVIALWQDVQGINVPFGAEDGPASGPYQPFTGFTHTPQGAALAAITQSVQLSTAVDSQWTKILSTVAAPGEGRDFYAAHRALISITDMVDPGAAPEIIGYQWRSYEPALAEINVVQRYPDDSLGANRVVVVWNGEDWQLELPGPGEDRTATVLDAIPDDTVRLKEEASK